jgi:hypothetical protein
MRKAVLLVALVGCKWTTFDDLANETWVRSTQAQNVGSNDYAIAIAGTTRDASGGRLSVVSNDTPTYSLLLYDAKGVPTLAPNPERLAGDGITFGAGPIFLTDATGQFAVVGSNGSIVAYWGDAAAPGKSTITSAVAPDVATFAKTSPTTTALVIAAGTDLFVLDNSGSRWCSATDDTGAPLAAVALASDDNDVWVWTATGKLISYPGVTLATCVATSQMPAMGTPVTPNAGAFASGFAPGVGATVTIVQGTKELVVLAGHADKSTSSSVFVVDAAALTMVDSLQTDGLQSAALVDTWLALGFPARAVGSTITGQVELHALDATTGKLTQTADEVLNDEQPDANEQFGRSVAAMEFNGTSVLVVAAKSEIFAYFRTQLYPETRQP